MHTPPSSLSLSRSFEKKRKNTPLMYKFTNCIIPPTFCLVCQESFHAPSIPTHLCLFSNIYMHWKTWNKIVEKESKTTNKEVKESSTPTIAYTTTSPPLTPIYQVKVDRHNCFFHTPLFWCCGHCCTCGSPSILIMQALSGPLHV